MKTLPLAVSLMCVVSLAAQEGPATLPKNYKVQFENEWAQSRSDAD